MNKKVISLIIGIPAYNEERNIQTLLRQILRLNHKEYHLEKIIVIADGCTDNTTGKIKALKSKKVKLYEEKVRMGKSLRMSQLLSYAHCDLLLFLDADIQIKNQNILDSILQRVSTKSAGLISVKATPFKPKNYFQSLINYSVELKSAIAKDWQNGMNYLGFKGCFLLLDKSFIKKVHFTSLPVNDDAYLYFSALLYKFKPVYIDDVEIYYRSPINIRDHMLQSTRFKSSYEELQKLFSFSLKKYYRIPRQLILTETLLWIIRQPAYAFSYLGVLLLSWITKLESNSSVWEVAKSTK